MVSVLPYLLTEILLKKTSKKCYLSVHIRQTFIGFAKMLHVERFEVINWTRLSQVHNNSNFHWTFSPKKCEQFIRTKNVNY